MKLENANYYEDSAKRVFSGKDVLSFKGRMYEETRAELQPLPKIGMVILYNENLDQIAHDMGSPGFVTRGIGRVVRFVGAGNCMVSVMVRTSEHHAKTECLQTIDFVLGLIRWVELEEEMCIKEFSWRDMDIDNPHESIAKNIKGKTQSEKERGVS